ncbi:unnamed protein product [Rangifer tarandus platyrhynchus]|uniref:Uncharacterized protein n=1 Tax=Rangifer tarandus platyrhynchus TaxID=3082113 RepID=A0AC60A767_RANTA
MVLTAAPSALLVLPGAHTPQLRPVQPRGAPLPLSACALAPLTTPFPGFTVPEFQSLRPGGDGNAHKSASVSSPLMGLGPLWNPEPQGMLTAPLQAPLTFASSGR